MRIPIPKKSRTLNELIQLFDNQIAIYPNPVTNFLNIKTEENIIKIEIFNYLGKSILKSIDTSNVDVSSLSKGIYLVKVNNDRGDISIQKMIKI